jgi:putative FmdB family regulatory protein
MPTYVYECAKCGDEVEVWQSFQDPPLKRHADGCGGKLSKVFQPVGIVLKGSGFYKTDSRSGNGRNGSTKGDRGTEKSEKSEKSDKSSSSGDGAGSSAGSAKADKPKDSGKTDGPKAKSSAKSTASA